MLNIIKNTTIFPDYIKLNLNQDFVKNINNLISDKKQNISDAVIYSFVENKNIKSERRKSLKTSFKSDELEKQIKSTICPLIFSMLKKEYEECEYYVEIGTQSFDYIKYDNGGYFEPHRDWVRVTNSQQIQYTLIIGLTELNNMDYGGNTIIWIPLNHTNQYDYKILTESDSMTTELKFVCSKYNLSHNYDDIQQLLKINLTGHKYIPSKIKSYTQGSGLLFQSSFLHSGESFYNWIKPKELLTLTINITGVENKVNDILENNHNNNHNKFNLWIRDQNDKFICYDEFEGWMCNLESEISANNLLPFQIIISSGTYNDKQFSDKYLKYLNLDEDLNILNDNLNILNDNKLNILEKINKTIVNIYEETKKKLNNRGKEAHIKSKIITGKTDEQITNKFDEINFDIKKINITNKENIVYNLTNFMNNIDFSNNSKLIRFEEILNTWEESGCNDDGDEYDETTYLTCQIDIKFGFYKI